VNLLQIHTDSKHPCTQEFVCDVCPCHRFPKEEQAFEFSLSSKILICDVIAQEIMINVGIDSTQCNVIPVQTYRTPRDSAKFPGSVGWDSPPHAGQRVSSLGLSLSALAPLMKVDFRSFWTGAEQGKCGISYDFR
jgi:hypothetical protein